MKTLLVVHKTHLDVGYTDLAAKVIHNYLEHFIPAALQRAREMNRDGEAPRFVWTSGAWIIWKALHTYKGCRLDELVAAIERGWIVWHALPFTFHSELLGPGLLRLALRFSQDLDARFGRQTISAKMTDVPGHTLGLVPVLAEAGVRFLHIGVNPSSKVPDVPPVFRWRANDRDLIVAYAASYGDVCQVPGCDTALTFLHTNDNHGPPLRADIEAEESWLTARHRPEALRAGTMDEFARALLPHAHSLPVVDAEIGDSWIFGAASDPHKLADFAAMRRVIEDAVDTLLSQPLAESGEALEALLLIPEHTWGLDGKGKLDPARNRVADLATLADTPGYQSLEASWQEQRDLIPLALAGLPSPLRGRVDAAIHESRAARLPPSVTDTEAPWDMNRPIQAGRWLLRFIPGTGCLSQVFDQNSRTDLIPPDGRHAWGLPLYRLHGSESFERYLDAYVGPPPRPGWADGDLGKPGIGDVLPHDLNATLRPRGCVIDSRTDSTRVRIHMEFSGERLLLESAPAGLWIDWTFHHKLPRIDVRMGWERKAATRLAESIWFGFHFPPDVAGVRLRKLGQWVDPSHVVKGGGRGLHAIQDRLHALDGQGKVLFTLGSPDAPLVSPDLPTVLTVPHQAPDGTKEAWFLLANNLWSTNFPQWISGGMGYRFRVELPDADPGT
jgi:hypothetical protein